MMRLKVFLNKLRKPVKFAAYDPQNFDELFGVTTSRINVISLVALIILIVSFLLLFLVSKTSLREYFFSGEQSIAKSELIDQRIRLDSLKSKIDAQDHYIKNLNNILFGTVSSDSLAGYDKDVTIDVTKIKEGPSKAEIKLAENVKSDQYTTNTLVEREIVHFFNPLKGYISQKFNKEHQAVDIVAKKDTYFLACLPGTVIYSDFSTRDGYVLIIEHSHQFISIYKHAKTILKKRGDRVQVGEMIGIVGNTGTGSTGPHLHFELWLNQKPVDPSNYIQFES